MPRYSGLVHEEAELEVMIIRIRDMVLAGYHDRAVQLLDELLGMAEEFAGGIEE